VCPQLERNIAATREAMMRTEARAQHTAGLDRERGDLQAQNMSLAAEVADAERSLASAREDKAQAEGVRTRMRAEHSAGEQNAGNLVRTLQRELDAVTSQTQSIVAYNEAGKAQLLARCNDSLAAARARVEENERSLTALNAQLRGLDEEARTHETRKRLVDDNVAYRQNVVSAEQLTAQVEEQAAQQEALGDMGALRGEHDRLAAESQSFLNEQNVSRGRMTTYKEQMEKCRKELKDGNFKNVDDKYRSANIELRTTEMANEDLNKYHAALDKALMAFHSAKMAEINKVVKELWQKTYRNQDIEYIAICSDAESTTGRSYNYRVVMKNGDAELDMRGRCSAGQKVLACLIIRLALAETFCLNCGILALDEPTTNLDAPNSTSLAHALTDIMQSRRDQENFQLIVITHDVRFAHLIGQREHAEYYWRISKDEDMHSRIEKEDILE
jgi:DNA repair protein RAD50